MSRHFSLVLVLTYAVLAFSPHMTSADEPRPPGFVPPDYVHSLFEEPVTLPSCDPAPDTVIIDDCSGWAPVNNTDKTTFCVKPGDYSSCGTITLTADGSEGSLRVIRYYDPEDPSPEHPAKRTAPGTEAVIQQLDMHEADYWVIDGITIRDATDRNWIKDSSHNVFNRLLVEDGYAQLYVNRDSDYNVIQNSVLRNQSPESLQLDRVCVFLDTQDWDWDPEEGIPHVIIEGTRIVNNEIYNCNDGIQLSALGWRPGFYPGTVIENNDIYITEALYSDCSGNYPISAGQCACAENAIDIKGADIDQTGPVRVLNNRMWGFRKTDTICGGSGDPGFAMVIHGGNDGVVIAGNAIMDSTIGISLGTQVDNIAFVNNLMNAIHADPNGLGISAAGKLDFFGNTIIDTDLWAGNIADIRSRFECNAILDAGFWYPGEHVLNSANYNAYYSCDGPPYCPGGSCDDIEMENVGDANHESFTFTRYRWTNPTQEVIPNAIHTASTPQLPDGFSCDYEDPAYWWTDNSVTVPAISGWGVIGMALLLMAAATTVLRRYRPTAEDG